MTLQALTFLCLHAASNIAAACSCPEPTSPMEQEVVGAYRQAELVALIEIASTEAMDFAHEENAAIWNPRTMQSEEGKIMVHESLLVAKFKPLHIDKGRNSSTQLQTPAQANSCGVDFKPGRRYLVYAYGPENRRFSTSQCMRTALIEESKPEIEFLELMAKSNSAVFQPSGSKLRFINAIELIQSDIGATEELSRAANIAHELAQSDPLSGYSQTLQAEALSTWDLSDNGEPAELQQDILTLTDEALQINPKLAQAHIARARTYMKASEIADAESEIQKALRLEPQLGAAFFVQAEIYWRGRHSSKAADWMRYYLTVTKQPTQLANAHAWLGNMWREIAYHPQAINREGHLLMAWGEYMSADRLDPKNASKLVNFAAFSNEYRADFAAAKGYAFRALKVQESPQARYQLAAARYQELQAKGNDMDTQSLRDSIAKIAAATRVSLDQAVQFGGFHDVIHARLTRLQNRVKSP